ncbi:YwmB family TATA-box binding protein [Alkalibacillus salilacus]|uniref:RNase H-fold protein (Predicted Holliday junction resolvase) n=1 Tax=Alkalibacillus salilacus TaxID=284582 RepID=A0ABT9VI28_9BACI|nr:YwmB family TATA-box binding protein [Alkalibacillus salilacus]MDQ0160612.1 RNase H-fold protein (predicted Holliday junction resolvase) [Alkalibacillus salilacus]
MRFILVLLTFVLMTTPTEGYSEAQLDVSNLSNYVTSWEADETTFGLTMKLVSSEKELDSYKNVLNAQIQGNDHHKRSIIDESLSVVEITPNRSQLIYQVNTSKWNQEIHEDVQQLLESRNLSKFLENGTHFTFFQSTFDSKIDKNLFLEKVIEDFEVDLKTQIEEELLSVISGYSPNLQQRIPHEQEHINIQLAIREEGDRKNTVTIGTPILVIEY